MSKRINVNPDHYKGSGRERPGKHLVPDVERQAYQRAAQRTRRASPRIRNQERASRPRGRTTESS